MLFTEHPVVQDKFRFVAKLLLIALAYFISAQLRITPPYFDTHITLIWLPTGIAVATLLRWGYAYWPGIFLGAAASNFSIDASPLLDISIALGNTLGSMLTVWLLRRLKFHGALHRARDILFLGLAAAVGVLLSASGGISSLVLFGVLSIQNVGTAWLSWWAGAFVGVLLTAPLLLNISRAELSLLWKQRMEFLIWCMTTLAGGGVIFVLNNDANGNSMPLVFMLLPLVVWLAMRFGTLGSSLGLLLPVFIAIMATRYGMGPFHIQDTQQGLLLMWLYLVTMLTIGLMVLALQAERNRAEKELKVALQHEAGALNELRIMLERSGEGYWKLDQSGHITEVNDAYCHLSGYARDEIIGMHLGKFETIEQVPEAAALHIQHILDQGYDRFETIHRHRDGHLIDIEVSVSFITEMHCLIAFLHDISQRKQAERDIHQLAFYDPLTQLANRRLLMDRLQRAMVSSARNGQHGALLLLDLDHFKMINDTQGHATGDLLLIEVTRRLQNCTREGDSVARLGGDEFVVLLEGLSSQQDEAAIQADRIAENIRSALNQPYLLNDYEFNSTPSIGIALFNSHQESVEILLKHADVAMYQAKSDGRNSIRFFDPKMQTALEIRIAMETDLRHALEKQQFRLYYQVQMDNHGKAIGAEVLLRWQQPERGFVFPDQFIPMAEETGLIVPIGLWVLATACEKLKTWQQNVLTRDLTLAVNVSAKQFHQPDFVEQVSRALLESDANPSHLKLELTESAVLGNIDATIAKMQQIKSLGVRFSMDDFGTGYSSLQYLKRLPLAQIKIDKSFVLDITNNPDDAAIVQTIIAMSKALGLNVIAEGVETDAQRAFLDQHGCHAFQGYLFSKPLPVEEFEMRLSGWL
ncbi:MAG: EAL domain-containing protein [Gallionella sp.]|nr:EAL domain-containing protein [Gallionella sp.]